MSTRLCISIALTLVCLTTATNGQPTTINCTEQLIGVYQFDFDQMVTDKVVHYSEMYQIQLGWEAGQVDTMDLTKTWVAKSYIFQESTTQHMYQDGLVYSYVNHQDRLIWSLPTNRPIHNGNNQLTADQRKVIEGALIECYTENGLDTYVVHADTLLQMGSGLIETKYLVDNGVLRSIEMNYKKGAPAKRVIFYYQESKYVSQPTHQVDQFRDLNALQKKYPTYEIVQNTQYGTH